MPCGCGGSTQRASQTRRQAIERGSEVRTGGPVSLNDPSLYWNGPKRKQEPTRGHTRREG